MVLYIIGLGLGDEKDITVRGLECAKKCSKLFLEYYTSVLGVDAKKLEQFYGIPVILADRTMVCIVTYKRGNMIGLCVFCLSCPYSLTMTIRFYHSQS